MAVNARAGWTPQPPRAGHEVPRFRVLWLLVIALLLAATIWGRLAYWQVVEHRFLSQKAADEYTEVIKIPATRGLIYDREGRPLALDTTVYSVFLSPNLVPASQRDRVALALSNVLGVSAEQVLGVLVSDRKFAYVARRVPKDKADQLRDLHLGSGVGLQAEDQRAYLPGGNGDGTLAANLLGIVNNDGQGAYGVEGFYDQQLAGKAGYSSSYQDTQNRQVVVGTQSYKAPVNGANLTLTLDSNVQYAAERALAAGVKGARAESGSVIVMDPHTGGIVAWATYPSYNANNFGHTELARLKDPIVSDLYEPGSVMKVATLSGALDVRAITPSTSFYDPGVVVVAGQPIRDWDLKNHGNVTMTTVLEKSLNVGAIKAEQMEGSTNFYRYLQAFGFGRPTGVDLSGEANVPLRPLSDWRETELATAAFGQGIAVNMVQMCSAVNVVANQGRYAPPHVVDRIGVLPNPAFANQPQRQVLSPETAAQMTQMMDSVVQHGSGYTARVQGFELDEAGKTGTSQIPENGGYSADHVWASYVGFLPADNPRFTMLVMVRKPDNGSFDHNEGYYVSAPIWKQIASAIIFDWRITPPGQQ